MDHKFKITAGPTSNDCYIEMDGAPLKGVKRVSFELAANKLTILKLEIIGFVEVEGEFQDKPLLQISQELPRG